jgi:hypothetical protein
MTFSDAHGTITQDMDWIHPSMSPLKRDVPSSGSMKGCSRDFSDKFAPFSVVDDQIGPGFFRGEDDMKRGHGFTNNTHSEALGLEITRLSPSAACFMQ